AGRARGVVLGRVGGQPLERQHRVGILAETVGRQTGDPGIARRARQIERAGNVAAEVGLASGLRLRRRRHVERAVRGADQRRDRGGRRRVGRLQSKRHLVDLARARHVAERLQPFRERRVVGGAELAVGELQVLHLAGETGVGDLRYGGIGAGGVAALGGVERGGVKGKVVGREGGERLGGGGQGGPRDQEGGCGGERFPYSSHTPSLSAESLIRVFSRYVAPTAARSVPAAACVRLFGSRIKRLAQPSDAAPQRRVPRNMPGEP